MFKRANKITSLLVAAAAVVSLVPVTGVNAAEVKKVDSEEGTVYNAVAYKDGKCYIDGELNDKDEATYYVADGKYNALSDIDTGAEIATYGEKYVNIEDGDYFLDLDNGKVTDDSVKDDAEDDAASALRKKIKDDNDGRYAESDEAKIADLTMIPGAAFSENWYAAKYLKDGSTTVNYNVYTDVKGNYIDADYNLGKIKVETTGCSVNVENAKDTEDFGVDKNDASKTAKGSLSVALTPGTVLGQDKDYIYRRADITFTVDTAKTNSRISQVYGKEVNKNTAIVSNDGGVTVTIKVVQKMSKAQASDDADGAKYSKSVTNYVISDDGGKAETLLADTTGATAAGYSVTKDGKVISYRYDGKNVKAEAITLKTKAGLYYTDISDGSDVDVESSEAYKFDVDGNLWALDGGYIKKFNNDDDFDKVYKVDGSFEKLSVYNKDNMVAWNEDDEVYSLIGGKTTKEEEKPVTPEVKTGWAQATDGTWTYVKADGTKATGWLQLGSAWYYLKADGVMATGWVLDGATWYYLQSSGAMATGWVQVGSDWYYLNANGSMAANTTVGGYVLGANGAWVK